MKDLLERWATLAAWLLPLVLFWGALWVGIERTFGPHRILCADYWAAHPLQDAHAFNREHHIRVDCEPG